MTTRAERFRTLHQATYADLLRFVERRVPAAEAEDVVSSVYLTAWRRFDDVPEDARPWLFGVARHPMANRAGGGLRWPALDVRLDARESVAAGTVTGPEPADEASAAAVRLD